VVPQSSPGSTMAQLSQAPLEHVDVDNLTEEHARRAKQKGSSVNIRKERHMCPQ
jgi:hypothetical protein